jgi:putative heme-binding domain-containing protein
MTLCARDWRIAGLSLVGLLLGSLEHFSWGQPEPPVIAPTEARSPEGERQGLHLPEGFEVQLVASEPDIIHPINIAFDARGRLWVTCSVEYPFPAQGPRTRDSIKILEDFGPDGRARTITTYAADLNIPIGVLPLRDGALAHSIPYVWRLWGDAGNRHCRRKDIWLGPYGYQDTHGMTGNFVRGFDGWVYATHGFANTSQVHGRDGRQLTMTSGNVYRFRLDGSHLEYFTHGQVNPFGLAFDPRGNLYSCDCHSRPIYQLLRGAYYPSFGRPHDGLGFGPEMMQHMHGSTAIAGIVYYAAGDWPAEYQDNIFVGNVVTNRINRDRLVWQGSSPQAVEQPDLVRSDDPWFRPVCLQLGPDGALYVADFYNRIIGHYEVPLTHPLRDKSHGRIWRIVWRGSGKQAPPPPADWTRQSTAELVRQLGHANLSVRLLLTNELVDRGGPEVLAQVRRALDSQPGVWQRLHGLWVLERLGALEEERLRAAAQDPDAPVRVHVQRLLAERPAWSATDRALARAGLADADALVQRCAAEALGRHPQPDSLRPLLDLHQRVPPQDTHLRHVLRLALRDHLLLPAIWSHLTTIWLSVADRELLAEVCLGVPRQEAAAFLLQNLSLLQNKQDLLLEAVRHIARHHSLTVLDQMRRQVQALYPGEPVRQARVVRAAGQGLQARGASSEVLTAWAADLSRPLLTASAEAALQAGIELAQFFHLETTQEALRALLRRAALSPNLRRAAAEALLTIAPAEQLAAVGEVFLDAATPLPLRAQLAGLLANTGLPAARQLLVQALATAPAPVQSAIALALASSREGAEQLLQMVEAGKASARLLQEPALRQRLTQTHLPDLEKRLQRLTRGLPSADERLQQLLRQRRAGFAKAKTNPQRGAQVFAQHCAVCHQLANQGARLAPQLDGIGARGPDRLLEDILDPSRNVDQAFRATLLTLKNGQLLTGLLVRQEGDVLVLVDSQGKEQRIPQAQVEAREVSPLSPMPANFAEQLSEKDLYDLLAFLLEQRAPRKH